jgi:MFS transporter, OFA family, oxalate/formate antiporter
MHDSLRAFSLFLYNTCLGIFLTYGLFFSKVSAEFSLPPSAASFIFGTFALLYSLSSLVMGYVMDIYGAGKTMLIGGLLMSVGLIASSEATSFAMLVATYGLVAGMGTGSMWLPTSFVVFDRFSGTKAREAIGLVSAGTAFGTLAFSPLEAYVITAYGWRAAFLVMGIIVVLFALFAYSLTRGGSVTRRFNLRAAIQNFKTQRFGYLYGYYIMGNGFSRTLPMIFVVPLLQAKGLGLVGGSLALSLIGIGSIAGRFASRTNRTSEETVASLGFILQGVCIAALVFSNNLLSAAVVSLIFGIGYGVYIPQFALLIRKHFGTETYGTTFGLLLTSFGIGAFIGPVFEGYQLSVSGDYSLGFYVAAVVSTAVGLHLLLSQRRRSADVTDAHGGQRKMP